MAVSTALSSATARVSSVARAIVTPEDSTSTSAKYCPPMRKEERCTFHPSNSNDCFRNSSARMCNNTTHGRCHTAFNGSADKVTPLGPRAVVIDHILVTEQIFQDKPGVAGPFPDAAVGDDGFIAIYAFRAVNGLEFVKRFERAIFVGRFAPRNAARCWDVSAALRCFGKAGWRQYFAGEFLSTADIHQVHFASLHGSLDIRQESTNREVRLLCEITSNRISGNI